VRARCNATAGRIVGAIGVATLALVMAGCSFTGKQSTLDPKGPVAAQQLNLFYITVWVSLFIFIIVGSIMAVAVWRFRERPTDSTKPLPDQGHGNPLVEIGLIGSSIALLVIIAIPTMKAIWDTMELPTDKPFWPTSLLGNWYPGGAPQGSDKEPLEVTVTGYQWWWAYDYKQFGVVTANELIIPVGKVVKLNLRSKDVIHSYWLPKLAGKVDVIPGRANWLWLMADEDTTQSHTLGLYYGQCAEFCGESHAYMLIRARVVTPDEFAKWIDANKAPVMPPGADQPWAVAALATAGAKDPSSIITPAQKATVLWTAFTERSKTPANLITSVDRGAKLFFANCVLCHTINGSTAQGTVGPNLSHVAARASIAAGVLDNLKIGTEEIDPARQNENFYRWVAQNPASPDPKLRDIKPGNLMWYNPQLDQGLKVIRALNLKAGHALTDQDFHDLANFLQSLK